jgi:DNA-binding transcriptional LysR family regulator
VARRIAVLEKTLGVSLFYRTSRGYLLTPEGQSVVSTAEAMERAALVVEARARETSAPPAGRVRIAMPPEYGSHWLAPKLGPFRTLYPQIELQILVGTRQRDLSRGEAELAIQPPRPTQTGMVAVRLARAAVGLYAARSLIGTKRIRVRRLADLRDWQLFTYTAPFQVLQNAKWFQAFLGCGSIALQSNSTHALLAAARAGAGIAVLPRFVAREHDDLVPVSDDVASHDILLITHPEVRRDPKVRATADFLKQLAAEPPGLC